ncbi:MAG: HNH endonuclease [Rhodomicrobium sp.]
MPRVGAKSALRQFLLSNIGRVIDTHELWEASGGASQYGRRVRELREKGWIIQTHNDNSALKPGQYLVLEAPRESVLLERAISARLRAAVLDRDGFTCQMCGLAPGDIDPSTGRKVRLHLGHIIDKSLGGKNELSNLRALCSTCNQGAKNVTAEKPSAIWLLSQIRRAGIEEQRAVLAWLKKKFDDQNEQSSG